VLLLLPNWWAEQGSRRPGKTAVRRRATRTVKSKNRRVSGVHEEDDDNIVGLQEPMQCSSATPEPQTPDTPDTGVENSMSSSEMKLEP
jgi:hypothetical protein